MRINEEEQRCSLFVVCMKKRISDNAFFGVALLAGTVLVGFALLQYLDVRSGNENDAWKACDVSGLAQGETRKCGLAVVYRRTPEDKALIENFTRLLDDPASEKSDQPEAARNPWRSEHQEFFIFRPWAPVRGCPVELVAAGALCGTKLPEDEALQSLPYLTETCDARTWDMSGRLYRRDGHPPEKNLMVPRVQWISDSMVLIDEG